MSQAAASYRARLRTEGFALAACGVAGSVALVLADDRATQNAGSTAGQLVVVLILLAVLGPRFVRRAIAASRPLAAPAGAPAPTAVQRGGAKHDGVSPGAASAAAASPDVASDAATGEPTPLWHLPLVVAVLALPLVALGAWDAALRVTGGCLLVGLAQALLLAGVVRGDERATGRTYFRGSGSRIARGTRLLHAQDRG